MAVERLNCLELLSSVQETEDERAAAETERVTLYNEIKTAYENGDFNGAGFEIKGYYNTLAALQAGVQSPAVGDIYGVGTAAPYDIYIWDSVNATWVNNGTIQGPQGEKGEKGDKGDTGAKGDKGDTGAKGEQGIQGEKGDTGAGFAVLGYYTTADALAAITSPAAGAAYGIGTEQPYDIYIWDAVNSVWVNNGALQGAKGEKGDKGDTGAKGEKGDTGEQGIQGEKGEQGEQGISEVTANTDTDITGLLKGNGSKVAQATPNTDYLTPSSQATVLPDSGTALTANTIYTVSAPVGTYAFTAPATGWAHGVFTTDDAPSITFTGNIIGELPESAANTQYEFDVYNGVWIVQEVIAQ